MLDETEVLQVGRISQVTPDRYMAYKQYKTPPETSPPKIVTLNPAIWPFLSQLTR
ncbi:hypothetical protein AB5N19_00003 [Seiridium cardinale]